MAGLPPIQLETAKKLFAQHGCTLLEKEWPGSKAPLRYRCKCGHERVTCWNNFSRGFRCKLCYMKRFAEGKKRKIIKLKMREKLFTLTEAADILGVKREDFWREVRYHQRIPAPTRAFGLSPKRYYNEKDIMAITKLIEA
jgi:hypothetical protein